MTSFLGFNVRSACPACGGSSQILYRCQFNQPPVSTFLDTYYRRSLDLAGEYRVEECRACGTMFQAEVGNDALLNELYGNWIQSGRPEEDPVYCFDVSNPHLSRDGHEIMAAASFLHVPLKSLVTLDYGMGWASWARISKSLGCQSHGFDLSPKRQEHAQKHGISTDLDTRFHFINTEQFFEHTTDPLKVISELSSKLEVGGILKISVPSDTGVKQVLARKQDTFIRDEIMPLQPLEHVNCFSREGLTKMGGQFGLRPIVPSYRHRFAFLPSVSFRHPKIAIKELIRPFWQWNNRSNLYVWMQSSTD